MVSNRQESPNLDNQFQLLPRRSIKLPFPHHLIINALLHSAWVRAASKACDQSPIRDSVCCDKIMPPLDS